MEDIITAEIYDYFLNMKALLIVLAGLFLVVSVMTPSRPTVIATATMDGKGHYLLYDYEIDQEKCLLFTDWVGNSIRFCGAYKVTPMEEYYRLLVQDLKHRNF